MTLGNPAFSVIRQNTIPKDAGLAGVYCILINMGYHKFNNRHARHALDFGNLFLDSKSQE
jgi:hypothetical protein